MKLVLLAQVFGFISFIVGCITVMTNKKKTVIICNTIANLANSIQYILLGAFTGAFTLFVTLTRNYLFSKKKTIPFYYVLIIIILEIIINIFSYDGIISILPVISVACFTYGIWQKDIKKLKIINISDSIFGLIYDLHYIAYVTAFAQGVYIVIGLISYFKYMNQRRHRIIKRKRIS